MDPPLPPLTAWPHEISIVYCISYQPPPTPNTSIQPNSYPILSYPILSYPILFRPIPNSTRKPLKKHIFEPFLSISSLDKLNNSTAPTTAEHDICRRPPRRRSEPRPRGKRYCRRPNSATFQTSSSTPSDRGYARSGSERSRRATDPLARSSG